MKILVGGFALVLLLASFADAGVWLKVYAVNRKPMPWAEDVCKDKVDGKVVNLPAFADEGACTAAGHTWVEEALVGSFDRGDIVSIKPSGFGSWGVQECSYKPPAVGGEIACVEITDKDEVHARNYIKEKLNANLVDIESARFYVDVAALPVAIKDALWDDGEIHKTWAQIKPYIMDKETGLVIP